MALLMLMMVVLVKFCVRQSVLSMSTNPLAQQGEQEHVLRDKWKSQQINSHLARVLPFDRFQGTPIRFIWNEYPSGLGRN